MHPGRFGSANCEKGETKEQRTERFTYHSTRYRKKRDEKKAKTAKDAFGDGAPPAKSVMAHGRDGQLTTIRDTDPHCDAMVYPIFYPRGTFEWHKDLQKTDKHCTVRDCVAGDEKDGPPGKRIVLPSSFSGSPRAMVQDYQDAMSSVAKYGKPDYFLTVTCNPKCLEIKNSLEDCQTASDHPYSVARVFRLKVNALFDVLLRRKLFGEVAVYVQVY
uniref:Helitron_like_N domain-containing protein n=1 Tax=Caenorhabditis japonica TaxID=281687 RepID=A0A8R1IAV4_CAEJA